MANILDYIDWRGDLSFAAAPFNDVDNVIFTQLVYLKLEGIVPAPPEDATAPIDTVSVAQAAAALNEKLGGHQPDDAPQLQKDALTLLLKMAESPRYKDLPLSCYVNDISEDEESQFSAIKIELWPGSVFISYCGTDSTVVGWKEDANMSYLLHTPGQRKAVAYLNAVLRPQDTEIRLGGHSKGGNLAAYTAIHAPLALQKKLAAVYSDDGPGLTDRMINKAAYKRMLSRIHWIIPQESMIGTLFEHWEQPLIVRSEQSGILQHNAFNWQVLQAGFLAETTRTQDSLLMEETMRAWLATLDAARRKAFINSLFRILADAGIDNMDRLHELRAQGISDLIHAAQQLKPDEKSVLESSFQQLMTIYAEKQKDRISWLPHAADKDDSDKTAPADKPSPKKSIPAKGDKNANKSDAKDDGNDTLNRMNGLRKYLDIAMDKVQQAQTEGGSKLESELKSAQQLLASFGDILDGSGKK